METDLVLMNGYFGLVECDFVFQRFDVTQDGFDGIRLMSGRCHAAQLSLDSLDY